MPEAPVPFAPRFRYSDRMVRDLMAVGGARSLIDQVPLPPAAEVLLVSLARLNSTRHSTEIEGNTLSKAEIRRAVASGSREGSEQEREVRNYWRALEWLEEQADRNAVITEDFIQSLHAIIDTSAAGRKPKQSDWRQVTIAVSDSGTGRPVFVAPAWEDVPALMKDLAAWARGTAAQSLPPPVRAALIAHRFLTIHPFRDGNGRTARALATYALWTTGFRMRGFLSVEEHYAVKRPDYYAAIQMGLPVLCYDIDAQGNSRMDCDHTEWLEFFCGTLAMACDGLVESARPWIRSVVEKAGKSEWENLDRRQQCVLVRMLGLGKDQASASEIESSEIVSWFGVSRPTAVEWLREWEASGLLVAVGQGRYRKYVLEERWREIGARISQLVGSI